MSSSEISASAESFLTNQLSCLDDVSHVSPPSDSEELDLQPDSNGIRSHSQLHQRGKDSSSESNTIIGAALMAGGAVIIKKKTRKKNRTSGVFTTLFRAPLLFITIAEFYGPQLFRKTYRMSQETFDLLLDTVRDRLDRKFVSASDYRRETIPADIRLAITLRILAGASYCDICLAYQVKASTVSNIFNATCDALMDRLHLEGFPRTKLALQRIAEDFQTSRPEINPVFGCVGALDGICVKIKKPAACENPASFYSRKGFYALPVQALCDSNYTFRYCSAVCTGATHDALAYAVSGLKKYIDSGILGDSFYIVGDEACTCTEELITPFPRNNADYNQMNFNFFLSSMRIHIEQAFGMLVARWRVLKGGMEHSVSRSTEIVCLLMKLHNFCIKYDGPDSATNGLTEDEIEQLQDDIKEWYVQTNELSDEFHPRVAESASRSPDSRNKRDALVKILKSKNRRMPNPVPFTVSASNLRYSE